MTPRDRFPRDGPAARPPPTVRVLLRASSASPSVRVETPGRYRIEFPSGRDSPRQGSRLAADYLLRGGTPELRVVSEDGPIRVDGRPYPGAFLLVRGSGSLVPVIETDVESYLPGVLAGELGSAYPAPTLRAQAIASRTFALSRARATPAGRPWHVTDDTSSQVFLGVPGGGARPLADAVADTRGMVLTTGGSVFPAYFHSTCGGHTASASDVFKERPLAPLGGVPCGFCREGRLFRHTTRVSDADLSRLLSVAPPLRSFEVSRRTADGRATEFRLVGATSVALPATEVRTLLGPEVLRSTLILEIRRDGDGFLIAGGGWGHGVGMCQVGAAAMGRAGASAGDILAHYYPGAVLTRAY